MGESISGPWRGGFVGADILFGGQFLGAFSIAGGPEPEKPLETALNRTLVFGGFSTYYIHVF